MVVLMIVRALRIHRQILGCKLAILARKATNAPMAAFVPMAFVPNRKIHAPTARELVKTANVSKPPPNQAVISIAANPHYAAMEIARIYAVVKSAKMATNASRTDVQKSQISLYVVKRTVPEMRFVIMIAVMNRAIAAD